MTGGRADHWFKPRRYGAGATPVTWQGWATTAAFPLVCAAMVLALFALMPPVAAFILLAILLPAAAYAFIAFARGKTDGQWDSRWGGDNTTGQNLK
jgi:hypothetical protein